MNRKQRRKKRTAFTIVELLTVMSIIVILIGLLVPALNKVKIFATKVRQKAQFHSMEAAIELFNSEFDGYPPSDAMDENNEQYCGAMKLCEAMMGQDMLGFHMNSVFRMDGQDRNNVQLYDPATIRARKGPFLQLESAAPFQLVDIYGTGNTKLFNENLYVLCDVYTKQRPSGEKTGLPILYYKADTANNLHDPALNPTPTDNMGNIYNYWDNNVLVDLGKPGETGATAQHALADPEVFYEFTRSHKIKLPARPYRADSYILWSAGYDGEYGTADDVFNFDWKSRSANP